MSASPINPFARFAAQFRLAGPIQLDHCPVCGSQDIGRLWQLPQTRLSKTAHIDSPGSDIDRLYLDYLPTLKVPQDIFCYDICARCESVFRNPKDDDHAGYATDTSKVARFKQYGASEFLGAAKTYQSCFPNDTRTVVDAACGAGQVLSLLKELRQPLKLIGMEMSAPSVAFITSDLGIESHLVDLDRDDLDSLVAPGSVDFVIFQEAFEHVRDPIGVLRKLLRMLRSGGRLHFTAQRYGEDNELQIRVGEPIFISDQTVKYIVGQLDAKVHEQKKDIKFRIVLEKN